MYSHPAANARLSHAIENCLVPGYDTQSSKCDKFRAYSYTFMPIATLLVSMTALSSLALSKFINHHSGDYREESSYFEAILLDVGITTGIVGLCISPLYKVGRRMLETPTRLTPHVIGEC